MTAQPDTLVTAAYFFAMVGGLCVVFAVLAWLSDYLTQRGERRTDRAREDLRRAEFFRDRRLP